MLNLLKHPLLTHKLTHLRRTETDTKEFRQTLEEIAGLMAYEITRDLPVKQITVQTPMASCTTQELANDIVLIPVLRAGLGMVNGISALIPSARVGHIGIYRDHETLQPNTYYSKIPENISEAVVMVLDPMLATGGSASAAISFLKERGAVNIKLVCIIGAPEGVKRITGDHPDVQIYLAGLDEKLNPDGYIVPGLGDAGDRLFGTR
ncbi:MAG TPA: uracil phosphoribosyltransferase [Bacteroidales bacterium]|nr:uracil phosphoribosyltransferase [Bacteroidales bacterium]HPF01788.1 uracil phosphoribosyltransferase [Bacteroidales bacterium]HPJ59717.1 uracil phosphoribosyltransferase [Bacteroidales bacterium]HPR11310.1 uracil phosphoribosyltransferase [Bacteroidales bacterium]HRW86011.1 uracil phosphoribosyltransferase [Bacteroidales bacterium]